MVGELHIELVGGRYDGGEWVGPSVCECCGQEVTPGHVIVSRTGERYVIASNRSYAFHLEPEGSRG